MMSGEGYKSVSCLDIATRLGISKGRGGNYHCPNTSARNNGDMKPSLQLSPAGGKCHGCGINFNGPELVIQSLGYNITDAVKWISEEFNLNSYTDTKSSPKQAVGAKQAPDQWQLRLINADPKNRFICVPKSEAVLRDPTPEDLNNIKEKLGKTYSSETFRMADIKICEKPYYGIQFPKDLWVINPNNNTKYLVFEGRTDALTAIEFGFSSHWGIISRFNKTSKLQVNPESTYVCVLDRDDTIQAISAHIDQTENVSFVTLPDNHKDFSDFMFNSNGPTLGFTELVSKAEKIPDPLDELESKVYFPKLADIQEAGECVLSLNDVRILERGNLSAIVSPPGYGKTSVLSAIASSMLNPDCDTLGFSLNNVKKCLMIDTEQTTANAHKRLKEIYRRAECNQDSPNLVYALFSTIPDVKDRNAMLMRLINKHTPDLVILDGLADFLNDVNDPEKSNALVFGLSADCKINNYGIVFSIHDNPTVNSQKPRGHLGSEILRRSESVLYIKKEKESEIRSITMNFLHGKNRNDIDSAESFFTWSQEKAMFAKTDFAKPVKRPAADEKLVQMVTSIFKSTLCYSYTGLCDSIAVYKVVKPDTAKKWISKLIGCNMIVQIDGKYYANGNDIKENDYPF